MSFPDHKTVALPYAVTALVFLFIGFLLMLWIRWQLAWPTSPLPSVLAAVVGEANAPSGYMAPEFSNQLIAMHGSVMVARIPNWARHLRLVISRLAIGLGDVAIGDFAIW